MAERILSITETVESLFASPECDFFVQQKFDIREIGGLTSFDITEQVLVRDVFHPDGLGLEDWLWRLTDSVDVQFNSDDLMTVAKELEWKSIVDNTLGRLNG